jgi:hypothetical protein
MEQLILLVAPIPFLLFLILITLSGIKDELKKLKKLNN